MVSGPGMPQPTINQVAEKRIQAEIYPEYPEQTVAIGSTLTEEGRKELCGLLRRNLDIFAWKPADMTGVPRHIAKHRLNIREGCLPIRQKKRGQAPERNKAICKEVEKLVDADIVKEVHYHSWLSNPVMVKKHDGSWRMCVDFKDLNKACLKDGYPLSEIDWKVESFCGYPFKCFLYAYKGYHQIKMAEKDEEKTAFITSQGIFCYSKMSFRLKNVRATYQRLVDKAFQKQIGRNLEVYVDDLVIKSCTEKEVIRDIKETFKTLIEINMKLNPKKCAFGMREGTFMGYKVNTDGLRVCLDKVEAVLNLPSPKCLKDVQKLYGKLASLNKFLSKSAEKSLPFFKTLKKCTKKSDFQWTTEAEIAFKPRTSVKRQIMADFIVERPEDDHQDTLMDDKEELLDQWILFTDGSSCIDSSGASLIITNPKGMEFTYALRFMFNATNNEAECEALIAGLRIAKQMVVENLQANVDSKLVANQMVETEEILPEEKRKARAIRCKAGRYAVANGILYKKFFLGPWLRCVGPLQANYVLRSLGEGIKARLDERSKNWLEEISHVLWTHRTMIKSSNGETPFSLTYRAEAVIPVEIGMPTLRTTKVDMIKTMKPWELT
nr:reverse transcriptase domain-containing protein [Tanacetum cinerariifolium]